MNSSLSSPQMFWGLTFILLALVLCAANLGAIRMPFSVLWNSELQDYYLDIWLNVRMPRVLLAVLVGAALATSGVIMQGLFRNPMADPGLLGVSSGSALMVGMAIVFPVSLPALFLMYEHMLFAVLGSLLICTFIFFLSGRSSHGGMLHLLLAGIAINALCGAAIGILS